MGQREYAFNRLLRDKLAQFGFHFCRIENHSTDPGTPDVHFVTNDGLSGWIEIKDEPRGWPSKVKYEKGQVPWLLDYDKKGGFCCTIVHIGTQHDDVLVVVDAKNSHHAAEDLRNTTCAVFNPWDNPATWQQVAEFIREGAQRKLCEQLRLTPTGPGRLIREHFEQFVGASALGRKPS